MPADREERARRDARPEDGRAIVFGQARPLDERGAEREVGEHEREQADDHDHAAEPVVVRREQPRQHHCDGDPRRLEDELRGRLPRKPAKHASRACPRKESPSSPRVDDEPLWLRCDGCSRCTRAARRKCTRASSDRPAQRRAVAASSSSAGSSSRSSTRRTWPSGRETAGESKLMVVDRLAEPRLTRDHDRPLAVREGDRDRTHAGVRHDEPRGSDVLDELIEGDEVDALGSRQVEPRRRRTG